MLVIDQATLITYILIVLGFVFIPGPATILTVARATTSGTRVGIATGLGIAVGDLIHTALAVVGISAIILASAFLFSVIKYLGAAYLVYLGLKALFAKTPVATDRRPIAISASTAFRQAIIAEVLNPKTALFFLAFLPQFVNPANGWVVMQLSTLGLILVLLGFVSTLVFALTAGKVGSILRSNPSVVRWQSRLVGSIYCALGVRLAFQER